MEWNFVHTNVFWLCKRWVCGNYYLFTISCMCSLNIRVTRYVREIFVFVEMKMKKENEAGDGGGVERSREHRNWAPNLLNHSFFALLFNFAFGYMWINRNHISEPRMLMERSTQEVVYVIIADVGRKRWVSLNWHWTENSNATETKKYRIESCATIERAAIIISGLFNILVFLLFYGRSNAEHYRAIQQHFFCCVLLGLHVTCSIMNEKPEISGSFHLEAIASILSQHKWML